MKFVVERPSVRIKRVYRDDPKPFWTLTLATFINAIGGAFVLRMSIC